MVVSCPRPTCARGQSATQSPRAGVAGVRDVHRQQFNFYARGIPTFLCSSDALRLSATVMFVMVVNPDDNSLEEIEVEPYDRFPTEEEARMFTEEGESFLYAHACFFGGTSSANKVHMLRSLRDSDLRRFGSCPETPVTPRSKSVEQTEVAKGAYFLKIKRADNNRNIVIECTTGKNETDEMTESESWPLQLQYPTVNDGGSTGLTTKNTTFTPPPNISTFWEILAEFAEVEEWSPSLEGPPKGVTGQ
jgi:hypothetical protein